MFVGKMGGCIFLSTRIWLPHVSDYTNYSLRNVMSRCLLLVQTNRSSGRLYCPHVSALPVVAEGYSVLKEILCQTTRC